MSLLMPANFCGIVHLEIVEALTTCEQLENLLWRTTQEAKREIHRPMSGRNIISSWSIKSGKESCEAVPLCGIQTFSADILCSAQ